MRPIHNGNVVFMDDSGCTIYPPISTIIPNNSYSQSGSFTLSTVLSSARDEYVIQELWGRLVTAVECIAPERETGHVSKQSAEAQNSVLFVRQEERWNGGFIACMILK